MGHEIAVNFSAIPAAGRTHRSVHRFRDRRGEGVLLRTGWLVVAADAGRYADGDP